MEGFFAEIVNSLTHYSPVLLFYTPWKYQKIFRFSFSGGIEKKNKKQNKTKQKKNTGQ